MYVNFCLFVLGGIPLGGIPLGGTPLIFSHNLPGRGRPSLAVLRHPGWAGTPVAINCTGTPVEPANRLGWQSSGLAFQRIVRKKERMAAPHKEAKC
jgi:hypothetical protein